MPERRPEPVRLLVPRSLGHRLLSRRRFIGMGAAGAAAFGFGLAGCGGDDDDGGGSAGGSSTSAATELESQLNLYTWAEYQDPDNVDAFSSANGVEVAIDVYDSNEAAIAKLELGGATTGYDIVVPTGAYIPKMVDKGMLQELDKSKIPNFANLDPAFLDQGWDPGNRYSAVKDWGSTGYCYDTSVITEELSDWADFFRACAMDGVSGNVAVLDAAPDLTGMVFWREGIDWTTTDPADLDLAEQILMDELVPHLKAFNSYPVDGLLDGTYVLAQMWNGDARTVVLEDPERYRWVLGAPKTELWIDNWCVVADAEHPEAAHAFINYMLDPEVSAKEIEWHGYNTAVQGTDEFLPEDLEGREIIFFTDEEKERLVAGAVNEAQDRIVEIYNNVQAAAGG
jgi:spermidine/putrescine transport system substrate-binding protein